MSTTTDPLAPRSDDLRFGKHDNPDARMPLMEHIRELRNRLLKAALGIVVGVIIGWIFFNPAWNFIRAPFCHAVIHGTRGCGPHGNSLYVTGVFDSFFVHLKVAFIVGLLLSSPVWFYQIWAFIAPGLYRREKKWTWAFVGSAVPLFLLGGFFAYLAMGRGLNFLLGLAPGGVKPLITIDTYFGYVTAMLLIFGIAFELPLVIVVLNMAGVLSHSFVKKWRRMMIFLVFVFAGAATPSPDPFSMLLLAIPCVVLVELAEVFVWLNDRRRARQPSVLDELNEDDFALSSDDTPPGTP